MDEFSRWVPVSFPYFNASVSLKLEALRRKKARPLLKAVDSRFDDVSKRDDETDAQHEARLQEILDGWDKLTEETFEAHVRLVSPLKSADDDETIDTVEKLYDAASPDFINAVMIRLCNLARLGVGDAKFSGSPSTSTVGAGRPSESSAVPAITPGTESSRSASTAEETIDESLFSQPV